MASGARRFQAAKYPSATARASMVLLCARPGGPSSVPPPVRAENPRGGRDAGGPLRRRLDVVDPHDGPRLPAPGDPVLVRRARAGSREAAAELFARHWPAAWRAALAVTGRRA